jgi:nitroreductase
MDPIRKSVALRSRNIGGSGEWPSPRSASVGAVDVEAAIRSRRTHKAYGAEPVDRETLEELFELARWAPNHNLTNPWRFRVLGPEALARLKEAAGPEGAAKLDRAPTLVLVTARQTGDAVQDEEDLCATAVATYIVLLAAHGRGMAGYWRTPGVLRTPEGRAALAIDDDERVVALVHLGPPRQDREPPERLRPDEFVTYLP